MSSNRDVIVHVRFKETILYQDPPAIDLFDRGVRVFLVLDFDDPTDEQDP